MARVRLVMVQPRDALRLQVLRGELAHLAGADDQHAAAGERAEDLLGQGDGGKAHRHRPFGQRRLGADALADAERPVEQLVQQRADGLQGRGHAVGVLDLAHDLRLPDHQRVEPAGDAEQVAGGLGVVLLVDVRLQFVGRQLVVLAQEAQQVVGGRLRVVAGDVHLGAVARRHHHRLLRAGTLGEGREGLVEPAAREVDPLAQCDRGRAVADAEQEQVHVSRSCGSRSGSS